MGMNESDYSCYLAIIQRLQAAEPRPGSHEDLRLQVLRFRVRLYESDRLGRPGPTEAESAKYLAVLGSVLSPPRVPPARGPAVDHAAMGAAAALARAGR